MKAANRMLRSTCLVLAELLCLASAAAAPPAASQPAADPIGRSYPRNAVMTFVYMANTGNYARASMYLELSGDSQVKGPELARQLGAVLDRAFERDIRTLSTEAEGDVQDGLPLDLEQVGEVRIRGRVYQIEMHRVTDPEYGPIWQFSPRTVAQIPEMYSRLGWQVRDVMPVWLKTEKYYALEAWQWLALLIVIPASIFFGDVISRLAAMLVIAIFRVERTSESLRSVRKLTWPLRVMVGIPVFHWLVLRLGFPLLDRTLLTRVEGLLTIAATVWLLTRIAGLAFGALQRRLRERGLVSDMSILQLGYRFTVVLVVVAGALAVLWHLGFDVSAVLAGLGIGGLAIAFAAQKSIENFFGGISVVADRVLRIGDMCRIGSNQGTVEDIGMRSTRIRTLQGTVLTIPNASFSTSEVESFAGRRRFLFRHTVQLRYETPPDQLDAVRLELRQALLECPQADGTTARVRFVNLGAWSLDLEMFAFVNAGDEAEYLEIQEGLLRKVLRVVNGTGPGFAFPSQTLYLTRDGGTPGRP
jgi:MscS family membrane protein